MGDAHAIGATQIAAMAGYLPGLLRRGPRRSTAAGKDTRTDVVKVGADGVSRHRESARLRPDRVGRAAEKGTINRHVGAARAGQGAGEFVPLRACA